MTHILEKRLAYKVLVGKPERKKPLGRPKCKWEGGNIKIDLQKAGHGTQTGIIWPRIWTGGGLL
jgi:hypothetical protein